MSTSNDLRRDLINTVFEGAANNPRGLQAEVGPSQMGVTCNRALAFDAHYEAGTLPALHPELVNHLDERIASDPWASVVGTAVHAWLEKQFPRPRWLTETVVTAKYTDYRGDPVEVMGHSDLYDTYTFSVIDHKVLGVNSLTKLARWGPSDKYRVQSHVYGMGYEELGYRVDQVSIAAWPRTGLANDLFMWSEPYDRELAVWAMDRLGKTRRIVANTKQANGPFGNLKLWVPTPGPDCRYCPLSGLCPDEQE